MCGIFCEIHLASTSNIKQNCLLNPRLYKLLQNRGPNAVNLVQLQDNILFGGFVLWQQGKCIAEQPLNSDSFSLLFNGDLYNICNNSEESDSTWISKQLSSCKSDDDIFKLFKTLEGPYSIIFFNKNTKSLYFGRDALGRNSLLMEKNENSLRVCSLSFIPTLKSDLISLEVPPLGIYKLDIDGCNIVLYPWKALDEVSLKAVSNLTEALNLCISTSDVIINPDWLNLTPHILSESYDFYSLLQGISGISIDELFTKLLQNVSISEQVDLLVKLLENSVKNRVKCTTKYCTKCIQDLPYNCHHAKIAILFSGGIDCTILAILADKFIDVKDSIDLINVAFETKNAKNINWDVPDRCTAKESLVELQGLCPKRKWNFIEVNITRQELKQRFNTHIRDLIYPLNTILDESIGCAFWFASQGIGYCAGKDYTSSSRVVLVGSGADELFGGYTRHKNAYHRHKGSHNEKTSQLHLELEMDWNRIPHRNLGRDDRVIADNGKTVRAPYIEENVVRYARMLSPSQRCCFLLEPGLGDKLLLRLCGYKLGLRMAFKLKKRAIQFGSRIADSKQNAKDISSVLQSF